MNVRTMDDNEEDVVVVDGKNEMRFGFKESEGGSEGTFAPSQLAYDDECPRHIWQERSTTYN